MSTIDIGIYKILNTVNNKCYIGQSTNISKRWKAHLFAYKKGDGHLYSAMKKYGIQNFIFQVEEKVGDDFPQLTIEDQVRELDSMEKWYIFVNHSTDPNLGYNESYGGTGGRPTADALYRRNIAIKKAWADPSRRLRRKELGVSRGIPKFCSMLGRRHSEESIQKMKHPHIGYTQKISEEERIHLANIKKIRMKNSRHYTDGINSFIIKEGEIPKEGLTPGRPHISETTRAKLSTATSGGNNPRAKPVFVIETQETFSCLKEVAIKYKINYGLLAKAAKKRETYKEITILFL